MQKEASFAEKWDIFSGMDRIFLRKIIVSIIDKYDMCTTRYHIFDKECCLHISFLYVLLKLQINYEKGKTTEYGWNII